MLSSSAHSRRRFRDIAALVDLTEDESEFTATTSMVQGSSNNDNNNNAITLSVFEQLRNERYNIQRSSSIQQQHSIEEEEEVEEKEFEIEDDSSVSKPHLSAFLLKQQQQDEGSYPTEILYTNTNAALDGEEKHENDDNETSTNDNFNDVRSQTYSSADLSMEAEAGKCFWGGSTGQRRFHSGRFHDRLRSRFSPPRNDQQQQQLEQQQPTKLILQQPLELTLNSTDSTLSCTLSNASPARDSISTKMDMDHGISYELPSPERSMDETPSSPLGNSLDEEDEYCVEENAIPSWKLKQRQNMKERMMLLESPSLLDLVRTPTREKEESYLEEAAQSQTPEEAKAALVTPPPPPEATREIVTDAAGASLEMELELNPPALARSRRAREFRRTFRHKAVVLRNDNSGDDNNSVEESNDASEEQNNHQLDDDGDSESNNDTEETAVPPSPVKRLRNLFEAPATTIKTKTYMDDPSLHEQRRRNHKVVAFIPKRSIAKEDESHEEEDGASMPSQPAVPPAAAWWTEMEERVDRYHRTVMAKSSSSNEGERDFDEDLRNKFEGFAESQNQLGRAMAVALFRGMELSRNHEKEAAQHARELQELRDTHETELRELRQQVRENSNSNASPNTSNRNEAFRQRWKTRMNNNHNNNGAGDDDNDRSGVFTPTYARPDGKTEVASTVVSTMSCRELSVSRYRARILQQMNKGKGNQRAPSTIATSVSIANANANALIGHDDRASDVSTPASESNNNKNGEEIQRLLDELQQAERRQKLLEKQLQQAGVVLAEDIPYQLAKDKVAVISKRMNEIGSSDVVHEDPLVQKQLREEYFRLEKDMQKYLSALMLTDEFAEEQRLEAEKWETKHAKANQAALEAIRKNMPVDIRTLTPMQLGEDRGLPKIMVQKFRRTNVLQLLRVDPSAVAKWHPSTLEAFRVTGLTLTERRALHCYLRPVADAWRGKADTMAGATGRGDAMTARKLSWYNTMRTNFQEAVARYERHLGGTNGTPRRHIQSTCLSNRCNLMGNQCPIRANKVIDYLSSDLGFPADATYENPMIVVGKDAHSKQKSPAEIIAEARGQPKEQHMYESPSPQRPPQQPSPLQKSKMPTDATTKSTPKKTIPNRPRHPMMSAPKGEAKPGGLLAAIAARRID
jgi:hypothetical protein